MKITAAVAETPHQPFGIHELDLAPPQPGEVLVRLAGTGICHTDLMVRDQWYPVPLPAVLGHEGSGVVEAVGDRHDDAITPGDHVVLSYASCGSCRTCLRGGPAFCEGFFAHNFAGRRPDGTTRLSRDGHAVHDAFFGQSSFATHAVVPRRALVRVDPALPLELLGPLGCGVQTGAGSVLNVLRCEAGSSIAVFGTGAVGCSAVMAAVVAGCTTVVAVGGNPARLALAEALGATHTLSFAQADPVQEIRRLTGGTGADYSLEATGSPAVLRQAVDCLRQGGTCGLTGAAALGTEVSLDMSGLLFGRTVTGILEGGSVPQVFIPELIDLYRRGRFPFDRMITPYPLAGINEAVADMKAGRAVKPVLVPGAGTDGRHE
ncbi:NAD(P)-dependent alcohol dehydrogenase [Streptomyces acidiscabies]|uniref:NAD(P)-dependent alcohol dehydrogenase n=1 Tax=Streptomyces acidiscabies TaxID=42234 RepID=UPI0038F5DFDF